MNFVKTFSIFLCLAVAVNGSPENIESRIVNGQKELISNRNYQMAVSPCGLICGGSLVKPNYVITAAHCVYYCTAAQTTVRGGTNNFGSSGQLRNVETITRHPQYKLASNINAFDYDVAVLRLKTPFTLNSNIGLIKIQLTMPPVGSALIVSGYGSLTDSGPVSLVLYKANIPMADFNSCNTSFGGNLTPRMVCAGGKGQSPCSGDSGGPLTYNGKLLGVISYGTTCDSLFPGVYTKLASYINWLTMICGVIS